MTVFVWNKEAEPLPEVGTDAFCTSWAMPSPRCLFCGDHFTNGERVWHWHIKGDTKDIIAHVECAKDSARGMIKDLAECTR